MGWEDPLEKGMATQSSILAWEIPWTEEPGWLQSIGLLRVKHNLATKAPPLPTWLLLECVSIFSAASQDFGSNKAVIPITY